ncbi:MAG: squalene/phytoene synthase family protein [Alphaproteobacteria bacterium]|nr:squalene/phytoene synthase family protein [Alphaproteobacteria bacterium]
MKTQKQENFPVACYLFRKKERLIISHYYDFARYCDNLADSPDLSTQDKLSKLQDAESSLFGKSNLLAAKVLRQDFIREKFDFSLATDLLVAFRQDAQNATYQTWAQLLDYCKYSAAPVGRFMLALYNESPSTYLPATALCSVLQIINHLQDLKDDVTNLNRLYLPEELMKKYKVSRKSLSAAVCSKSLQKLLNDVLNRACGLLKDAQVLPSIIKSIRLRIYVCIIIKLSDILIKKMYNTDILTAKINLSVFDWVIACYSGTYRALLTKRKTLTIEEH